MLRLDRVIKPWKESAALNAHINLFGFWNETAFLTKSGDLGMVLRISGIDYESLDNSEQDYAVKRLESALKGFGVGFHVYQYLFKSNRPDIPFATYDDPLIDAAIDQRRQFFGSKARPAIPDRDFLCDLVGRYTLQARPACHAGQGVERPTGGHSGTQGAVQLECNETPLAIRDRCGPGEADPARRKFLSPARGPGSHRDTGQRSILHVLSAARQLR